MIALVTGVTGQDGCYLSAKLCEAGYTVIGLLDPERPAHTEGLDYLGITEQIRLVRGSLLDYDGLSELLICEQPTEIYNLAAESSVAESFRSPARTMHFNTVSVITLLEAVRNHSPSTRVYHASSSEMFGRVESLPADEETPFQPVSPYAVSKVAAHQTVSCYRNSYDLFAVSGILFNHESYLRRRGFFTKKIIAEALEIRDGRQDRLRVGNIDIRRDFGYAPEYVEAMWRMLQQDTPRDYIICSGQSASLRELVEHVLLRLDLSVDLIEEDAALKRPSEIADLYGTSERARCDLGWDYSLTAFDVIDRMLDEEIRNRNKTSSDHPAAS